MLLPGSLSWVYLACILVALIPIINGQKEAGGEAMAVNMKKFQEIYGLATQLMNLGGNILNNAQQPGAAPSTQFSKDTSGNGIFGEVRPQLRSVPNYDFNNNNNFERFDKFGGGGSSFSNSEYGGGILGSGSRSQPRSILDSLMGSFLGSSLGGGSQASSSGSTSSIFQPTYDGYGKQESRFGNPKGSNIDAIVSALSRSGVKRAAPEEDGGLNAGSLLSQFFGGGRR